MRVRIFRRPEAGMQAESSQAIRERVLAARKLQRERFAAKPKCRANAEMTHGLLKTYCKLDAEGRELLHHAMAELHLSARAYDRILKVARTIADLATSKDHSPCASLRGDSVSHLGSQSLALGLGRGLAVNAYSVHIM